MKPELIEIDGQLYGGILREGSGRISCSCQKVTAVRQFRCVAVGVIEPRGIAAKEAPFFDWWVAALLICAGVICVVPYFLR